MQLVDGGGLEGETVEDEGCDSAEIVACEVDVGLLEDDWNHRVHDDPAVHGPVRDIGDSVLLCVDGDLLIQVLGVNVEKFVEPVEDVPF